MHTTVTCIYANTV